MGRKRKKNEDQEQEDPKIPRFTNSEEVAAMKTYLKFEKMLADKSNVTKRKKDEIWTKIAESCNAVGGKNRKFQDVKKKVYNIRSCADKKGNKASIYKTGGGPAPDYTGAELLWRNWNKGNVKSVGMPDIPEAGFEEEAVSAPATSNFVPDTLVDSNLNVSQPTGTGISVIDDSVNEQQPPERENGVEETTEDTVFYLQNENNETVQLDIPTDPVERQNLINQLSQIVGKEVTFASMSSHSLFSNNNNTSSNVDADIQSLINSTQNVAVGSGDRTAPQSRLDDNVNEDPDMTVDGINFSNDVQNASAVISGDVRDVRTQDTAADNSVHSENIMTLSNHGDNAGTHQQRGHTQRSPAETQGNSEVLPDLIPVREDEITPDLLNEISLNLELLNEQHCRSIADTVQMEDPFQRQKLLKKGFGHEIHESVETYVMCWIFHRANMFDTIAGMIPRSYNFSKRECYAFMSIVWQKLADDLYYHPDLIKIYRARARNDQRFQEVLKRGGKRNRPGLRKSQKAISRINLANEELRRNVRRNGPDFDIDGISDDAFDDDNGIASSAPADEARTSNGVEISHRNVVNNDTSRRNPVNTENNSSRSQENDGPNASNVAAPYLHDHIDEDGRNVRVQAHPSFATPARGRPWTNILATRAKVNYLTADRYRVDMQKNSIMTFNKLMDSESRREIGREVRAQEEHKLKMDILYLKRALLEKQAEKELGFIPRRIQATLSHVAAHERNATLERNGEPSVHTSSSDTPGQRAVRITTPQNNDQTAERIPSPQRIPTPQRIDHTSARSSQVHNQPPARSGTPQRHRSEVSNVQPLSSSTSRKITFTSDDARNRNEVNVRGTGLSRPKGNTSFKAPVMRTSTPILNPSRNSAFRVVTPPEQVHGSMSNVNDQLHESPCSSPICDLNNED